MTHQRLRSVQKSLSSKAAAIFSRGAYAEYVSAHDAKSVKSVRPKAEKWRERSWRLFSTDPLNKATRSLGDTITLEASVKETG